MNNHVRKDIFAFVLTGSLQLQTSFTHFPSWVRKSLVPISFLNWLYFCPFSFLTSPCFPTCTPHSLMYTIKQHTHTHTSQQYLLGSTGISQCCCLWWETWSSSQWASPSSRRRPQRPGSSSTWSRTLSSSWTWSSTFAQESSLRTTLTSF